MGRIRKNSLENRSAILQKVENLMNSPLKEVAAILKRILAIEQDTAYNLEQMLTAVGKMLKNLPDTFSDRFYFDSWIIQSIADTWSRGGISCSGMIIPCKNSIWGHWRQSFKDSQSAFKHFIDLIFIPDFTDNAQPALLDYSWIAHELGHHLLLKDSGQDRIITDTFNRFLTDYLSGGELRITGNNSRVHIKSKTAVKNIREMWSVDCWAKELILDAIALWSCGPAFIDAFSDAHECIKNAFLINKQHPPVALRTNFLIKAAKYLGWDNYTGTLEKMFAEWMKTIPYKIRKKYGTLNRPELPDICLKTANIFCNYARIPRMNKAEIDTIRFISDDDIGNGTELIIKAWIVYNEEGEVFYKQWETDIYAKIVNQIER